MSWGSPETVKEKLFTGMLMPAAAAYGAGAYARLMAYNAGFLKQHRLSVPVISIGNITVGGTGKTPVAIDLARRLIGNGYRVGILSRGYRRRVQSDYRLVSNGKQIVSTCFESGDEPMMMAQAVPEAVVIVGADRVKTAHLAVEQHKCDVLLLDDGFQHIRVARTHDVVLLDYADELENDHLLPAGRLREPLAGLVRADWVVVTKVPEQPSRDKLLSIRKVIARYAPQARVSSLRLRPACLQALGSETGLGPSSLQGSKVYAFCGIARPEPFYEQLRALGAQLLGRRAFEDHHWYMPREIEELRRDMEEAGAQMLVTTEKDAVRLLPELVGSVPVAVLRMEIEWLGPVPVVAAGDAGLPGHAAPAAVAPEEC